MKNEVTAQSFRKPPRYAKCTKEFRVLHRSSLPNPKAYEHLAQKMESSMGQMNPFDSQKTIRGWGLTIFPFCHFSIFSVLSAFEFRLDCEVAALFID